MSFLSTFITFHFCNFFSLFSPTIFFYMSFLFTIITTYFWSVFSCVFLNYFFQCNIYYIHFFFFYFRTFSSFLCFSTYDSFSCMVCPFHRITLSFSSKDPFQSFVSILRI